MENQPSKESLEWGVRRSVRYHTRRRQFFERFNLLTNASSVILGSGTVLAILSRLQDNTHSIWWSVLPAATVTFLSSLNLVIGTVRMSQLHHDLARRFLSLEQELLTSETPSAIKAIEAKRLQIEADEPPILRIVDVLCHNELMTATGHDPLVDPDNYYEINWFQKLFSPFVDVNADGVKRLSANKSLPCQ